MAGLQLLSPGSAGAPLGLEQPLAMLPGSRWFVGQPRKPSPGWIRVSALATKAALLSGSERAWGGPPPRPCAHVPGS